RMFVERMSEDRETWRQAMEMLDADEVFASMDDPIPSGPRAHAHFFVDKSLPRGDSPRDIVHRLTHDFDRQSIYRKERTFLALCLLYLRVEDAVVQTEAKAFL